MLNSAKHENLLLINVKMPTIVGILTFMSKKDSFLSLSEPKNAQLSLACKKFYNLEPRFKFCSF